MAAKKRKKKKGGQFSLGRGLKDERVPKLLGLLLLFTGLYLLVAFISYLFTWQIDQDRVLRFSWELLWQGQVQMANWLGRLGAIVSNFFFYYGFGLPSFILVFLCGIVGTALIRRSPVQRYIRSVRYGLLLMVVLSIIFELFAGNANFPWGGAIGEYITDWLYKFVGPVGLVLLIVFVGIAMLVWLFNPNFRELTPSMVVEESRDALHRGLGLSPKRKPLSKAGEEDLPLRPRSKSKLAKEGEAPPALNSGKPDLSDLDLEKQPKFGDKNEQLAFELIDKLEARKANPLAPGEGELEIEVNKADGGAEGRPDAAPNLSALRASAEDHSEPYDPTLELASFEFPVTSLLEDYSDQKVEIDREELEANKDQIIETLLNYKIEITKIRATIGPTVTLYEIVPAPGVRISKIKNLEDDIALSLAALGIRIIAPIPGKGTIGIEVPNKKKQIVSMKEVLLSEKFKKAKMDLPIVLGKTISNEVFVADLAKMPHLLVAGATGQGKSVGINAILMSLLFKKHPSQLKIVLIDPKKVELFPYSKLEHHFLACMPNQEEPIITDTNKVIHVLNSLCIEMDNRYDLLKKASARNLKEYNEKFVKRRLNPLKGHKFIPFIVLIIDEFADLIMTAGKEVEMPIGRLAQLARAVGIHLIIATQRPSVNIITGVIKANFPARIGFKVTAKVDSRTILDAGGADQLIGRGDMLLSVGGEVVRIQGAFVDTPEVERVIDFISQQKGYPEPHFLPEFHGEDEIPGTEGLTYADLDSAFEDAARMVVQNQHGSTSMLQRRLKLGYNRAGRIMDQLEAMGIVGPSEGSKAREVLIYDEMELERYLQELKAKE